MKWTALIEELGNEPLLDIVRKLGGWPVLGAKSGWTEDRVKQFNWLESLIAFRRAGFSHDILIDLSIAPDFRNNTRYVIDVSSSSSSYLMRFDAKTNT